MSQLVTIMRNFEAREDERWYYIRALDVFAASDTSFLREGPIIASRLNNRLALAPRAIVQRSLWLPVNETLCYYIMYYCEVSRWVGRRGKLQRATRCALGLQPRRAFRRMSVVS